MATPLINPAQAFDAVTKLVRPNRFAVDLSFPGGNLKSERIESVDFPSYGMETVDAKVHNQPIMKIPISLTPQNTCNIAFRLDSDGQILNSLYQLINNAFSFKNDLFVKYAEDLWGTINITAFKEDKQPIVTLTLSNAMVTSIEAVQLSYDERDSYLKQTVGFSYQYADLTPQQ